MILFLASEAYSYPPMARCPAIYSFSADALSSYVPSPLLGVGQGASTLCSSVSSSVKRSTGCVCLFVCLFFWFLEGFGEGKRQLGDKLRCLV